MELTEKQKLTYLKVKSELKELENHLFTEQSHQIADELLCELLTELGFSDIVSLFEDLDKWYA
jgi:hypothetical protein